MNGFVSVLRREVAEKRMVLLAGLVVGLVPLFAPLLPGASKDATEIRQILMLCFLCAFAWGAAIMLGGSFWARDLAEGRLGFFYSRPVSPVALFGGKLLAAFGLVMGASLLLLIPGALAGGLHGHWLQGGGRSLMALLVIGGSAALLPIANAAATAIRTRDRWNTLHLPLLVLTAAIVAWSGAVITRAAVGPTAIFYILAFALLVPPVLAIAGFVQAAAGRSDALRSHRALTLAAWAPLLGLALLGAGGAVWYAHPSPSSLSTIWTALPSPEGRSVFVAGTGSGLRNGAGWSFLLDASNPKRWVNTGAFLGYQGSMTFSRDGSTAAWLAPERSSVRAWKIEPDSLEIRVARLGGKTITAESTGLTRPLDAQSFGSGYQFTLSPHGARIALLDGNTVSVTDLATRKTLVAARVAETHLTLTPLFTDEDHVLLTESWGGYEKQPVSHDLALFELDVPARRLVRTGSVASGPAAWVRLQHDPSGERLLVFSQAGAATLHDARSGRTLATLAEKAWAGTFLADGRIALTDRASATRTLLLYSRSGDPIRAIDVGPARWVQIAGQPAANRLLIAVQRTESPESRMSLVLDLESGGVVKELPGLTPLGLESWNPATRTAASGPTFLFLDDQKTLLSLDVTTGVKRILLPR